VTNIKMLFTKNNLPKFNTFEDFRSIAKKKLPKMVFDFVDGGADSEISLRANRKAFENIQFDPHWLTDVSKRETNTVILGESVSMPLLLAPCGLAGVVHKEGELAVARAAERANTIFCISTGSCYSLEEIAAASRAKLWFQLYLWKSEEVVKSLVQRAKDVDCKALVLTVDVPAVGKRERDYKNGMSLPPRIRLNNILDASYRFRWLSHFMTGPEITFGNLRGVAEGDNASAIGQYVDRELNDPSATWEKVDWIRKMWNGPLAIKGILSARDAREAINRGVDAIYVSNHGGRQLDSVPGTADVLSEVVDAVNGRAEILLDGGIRRGEDIAKALALGADACLAGRPWYFGLAADGERGVSRVLEILQTDLLRTMTLLGAPKIDDINSSLIRPRQH
jgi:L-lactate dehydrogenase (cytochrome)